MNIALALLVPLIFLLIEENKRGKISSQLHPPDQTWKLSCLYLSIAAAIVLLVCTLRLDVAVTSRRSYRIVGWLPELVPREPGWFTFYTAVGTCVVVLVWSDFFRTTYQGRGLK